MSRSTRPSSAAATRSSPRPPDRPGLPPPVLSGYRLTIRCDRACLVEANIDFARILRQILSGVDAAGEVCRRGIRQDTPCAQVRRISWVRGVLPAGAGNMASSYRWPDCRPAPFHFPPNSLRKRKKPPEAAFAFTGLSGLLDLGFLEVDVLLRDRVVLADVHLLGLGAAVLLRHVEIAGAGGLLQLDLDRGCLGHLRVPVSAAPARMPVNGLMFV